MVKFQEKKGRFMPPLVSVVSLRRFMHYSVLLLFLCLASASLVHADRTMLSGADKAALLTTFESVLECRNLDQQNVTDCVAALTATDLSPRLNQKIAKWLFDVQRFGEMELCRQEVIGLIPAAEETRFLAVRCVSYRFFDKRDTAVFYFVEENGSVKLAGIQTLKL
ncbi:hypothetical protein [Marinobacter lipolyticus]|uniref:hypothetical protein n=1 Tax=Marinobacter lipolyticus TaxID=209639 RepID=UPI003A8D4886